MKTVLVGITIAAGTSLGAGQALARDPGPSSQEQRGDEFKEATNWLENPKNWEGLLNNQDPEYVKWLNSQGLSLSKENGLVVTWASKNYKLSVEEMRGIQLRWLAKEHAQWLYEEYKKNNPQLPDYTVRERLSGAVAAMETKDGRFHLGTSGGNVPQPGSPQERAYEKARDELEKLGKLPPWHGACAEVSCLNQVLENAEREISKQEEEGGRKFTDTEREELLKEKYQAVLSEAVEGRGRIPDWEKINAEVERQRQSGQIIDEETAGKLRNELAAKSEYQKQAKNIGANKPPCPSCGRALPEVPAATKSGGIETQPDKLKRTKADVPIGGNADQGKGKRKGGESLPQSTSPGQGSGSSNPEVSQSPEQNQVRNQNGNGDQDRNQQNEQASAPDCSGKSLPLAACVRNVPSESDGGQIPSKPVDGQEGQTASKPVVAPGSPEVSKPVVTSSKPDASGRFSWSTGLRHAGHNLLLDTLMIGAGELHEHLKGPNEMNGALANCNDEEGHCWSHEALDWWASEWNKLPPEQRTRENAQAISSKVLEYYQSEAPYRKTREWFDKYPDRRPELDKNLKSVEGLVKQLPGDAMSGVLDGYTAGRDSMTRYREKYGDDEDKFVSNNEMVRDRNQAWGTSRQNRGEGLDPTTWNRYYMLGAQHSSRYDFDQNGPLHTFLGWLPVGDNGSTSMLTNRSASRHNRGVQRAVNVYNALNANLPEQAQSTSPSGSQQNEADQPKTIHKRSADQNSDSRSTVDPERGGRTGSGLPASGTTTPSGSAPGITNGTPAAGDTAGNASKAGGAGSNSRPPGQPESDVIPGQQNLPASSTDQPATDGRDQQQLTPAAPHSVPTAGGQKVTGASAPATDSQPSASAPNGQPPTPPAPADQQPATGSRNDQQTQAPPPSGADEQTTPVLAPGGTPRDSAAAPGGPGQGLQGEHAADGGKKPSADAGTGESAWAGTPAPVPPSSSPASPAPAPSGLGLSGTLPKSDGQSAPGSWPGARSWDSLKDPSIAPGAASSQSQASSQQPSLPAPKPQQPPAQSTQTLFPEQQPGLTAPNEASPAPQRLGQPVQSHQSPGPSWDSLKDPSIVPGAAPAEASTPALAAPVPAPHMSDQPAESAFAAADSQSEQQPGLTTPPAPAAPDAEASAAAPTAPAAAPAESAPAPVEQTPAAPADQQVSQPVGQDPA
jgi:hypothetical protein